MTKTEKENGIEKPKSLADLVFDNYDIAAHWKDRKQETSFSGTLFKGKQKSSNPYKYVLALKGSWEWEDFTTDGGDIVLDGLAHHQIVDMYNFWQQITHVGEYKVANIISGSELEELEKQERAKGIFAQDGYFIDSVVNNLGIPNPVRKRIIFKSSHDIFSPSDERYDGLGINPDKVTVVGHSLGGHLSAAFSRLFPDVTEHAYMVNGAGFGTEPVPDSASGL